MSKPKILNLSNKVQEHVNVLRRGFKFRSTPLTNQIELKNNVYQFSRKLLWLELFYTEKESEGEKSFDDSLIKNKSVFNPPRDERQRQNIRLKH